MTRVQQGPINQASEVRGLRDRIAVLEGELAGYDKIVETMAARVTEIAVERDRAVGRLRELDKAIGLVLNSSDPEAYMNFVDAVQQYGSSLTHGLDQPGEK